jgi:membrane protein DedA with SNARE-associated domain
VIAALSGLADWQSFAPFLREVAPYIQQYGYWAILIGVLLESFGIPMPGETMLVAGGLLASANEFNVYIVIILGIVAAVVGDNIGYAIGYFGGRTLVLKFGKYVFLTEVRLKKLENFFVRHGGKVVAVARFVEGFRQFNGIIAGTGKMPWWRFLVFNVIGAVLWVIVWVNAAYFLGDYIPRIFGTFKRFETYVLVVSGAVVFVVVAYFVVRHFVRRHRQKMYGGD